MVELVDTLALGASAARHEGSSPSLPTFFSMDTSSLINSIIDRVKHTLAKDTSGHDWWHVYRVWQLAKRIGQAEGADMFVVELTALLHDIADAKFHNGDDTIGPRVAREMLSEQGVEEKVIAQVCDIIGTMSFHRGLAMTTLEGKVVQDADRLDAIGAVGISRVFAYGGHKDRPIHLPNTEGVNREGQGNYTSDTSIHHFYEKLLLLKDRMNTEIAKKMASSRHDYMEKFLQQFYSEWEGEV